MELQVPLCEEDYDELLRVQNLISQQESRPVSLGEVIRKACAFYREKKDPVVRAERALKKKTIQKAPKLAEASTEASTRSRSQKELGPGRVARKRKPV